jgi:hypothetical protein
MATARVRMSSVRHFVFVVLANFSGVFMGGREDGEEKV